MSEVAPVIYLLAGVTAAGKSEFSLKWAEQMGGEILSCDSIAIYRGMDIGSAKPSADDRNRVCHHGIDLVNADTIFSVLDYSLYANGVVDGAVEKSTPVLVSGGSGFYLQSFLSPVVDEIQVGMDVREQVEQLNEERGLDGLLQVLKEHNPRGLGDLDILNPRRVIRALERCLASGKPILELKKEFERQEAPYGDFEKRLIWLDRENEEIEARIAKRTQQMLDDGLLGEAEKLLSLGIERNPSASNSVGYRECIACLKGEIPEQELLPLINHSTRRLVSKQRKWFRKHFGSEARILMSDALKLNEPAEWNWVRHS